MIVSTNLLLHVVPQLPAGGRLLPEGLGLCGAQRARCHRRRHRARDVRVRDIHKGLRMQRLQVKV